MDNDDKISKLNKKFNNVMMKLEKYNGTDPESIVQQAYNKYFQAYFKLDDTGITRVEKCDSYFIKDKLVVLAEYKFNVDFSDALTRAKVIAQSLIYYKKIVDKGKNTIPNVIFIGDVNECFCFKAKHFSKHMSHEGVDYSVAASSAGSQMKLVQAIADDVELQNDIFIINPQKDPMSYICEKMAAMSFDKDAKIPITLKNITRVFEAFSTKICVDKKYSSNEMVGLFIDAIRYPEKRIIGGDYLVVPPYKPMKVDMMKTIGLFKFFGKPSDAEAKELTQIYDTLVKDDDRRRHGFFITPSLWSDLGHKYVADYFKKTGFIEDENWEESDKIVVWDCCCGTKSLTKSYRFKNLYLSTLEQSELNASTELSPEAKETFVFDFLNDPTSKLPKSLRTELQNLRHTDKKLCFLVNPPYGQAVGMTKNGKKDATRSIVAEKMKDKLVAYRGMDLFVQFIFRMNEIVEEFKLGKDQVIIATFSKPTWLNGSDCKKFRSFWFNNWTYDSGFMFNASEFENCSSAWGVHFTVMHNSFALTTNDFIVDVFQNDDGSLSKISEKTFHSVSDEDTMDNWAKDKCKKTIECIALHSGFEPTSKVCKMPSDAIGFFKSYGNVTQNAFAYLASGPSTDGHGSFICPSNADKAVQCVAVRQLTSNSWINDKDNYSKPDETHLQYVKWVKDCYIYHIASLACSLTGNIAEHLYDYKNNFFPFSKVETYKLLGQELMKNEVDEKRWCLANGKFDSPSPEGKAVLDAFAACIKASAPFRREFGQSHPELQLDHWDAGYRQMRELFKTACPEELKAFKAALKTLKAKMAPMVYTLGFLRK